MAKAKTLTERAADLAADDNATPDQLRAMRLELQARIDELERGTRERAAELDAAERSGSLERVRAAEDAQHEAKTESRILHRTRTDVANAMKISQAREAVAEAPAMREALAEAVQRTRQALAVLDEAHVLARRYGTAMNAAKQVGQRIDPPDAAIVRELAAALFPEVSDSERKSFFEHLGVRFVAVRDALAPSNRMRA